MNQHKRLIDSFFLAFYKMFKSEMKNIKLVTVLSTVELENLIIEIYCNDKQTQHYQFMFNGQ